jgi:16S rRNA (cytosine967-C5)-methyltransferase
MGTKNKRKIAMALKFKNLPSHYTSRKVALDAYILIHTDNTIKEGLTKAGFDIIDKQAKPFILFLIQETLRYQNLFQCVIEKYFDKKPQKKYRLFLDGILCLGVCEIFRSQQKTQHILSAYTEITKSDKKTSHLSGIVRAILGKILTEKDAYQDLFRDYKLIFGQTLYNKIVQDYPDDFHNICEALLKEPCVDITKLKAEVFLPDDYQKMSDASYRFQKGVLPQNLAVFDDGDITIQSFSSSLVIECCPHDIAGKTLLDMCSAPGGKTLHALSKGAIVTALDISPTRIERMRENLMRCHLNAEIQQINALEYKSSKEFDIILLDAPCSATGTIRKNPDILHKYAQDSEENLISLQEELLNHAQNFVKKDGLLIYSVCSLSHSEGEEQIAKFLKTHANFSIVSPKNKHYLPHYSVDNQGFIRILPHFQKEYGGHEGFFVAYLRKLD